MLQVTHLSLVDGRFAYDPLFAYGYMETYDLLLSTSATPAQTRNVDSCQTAPKVESPAPSPDAP